MGKEWDAGGKELVLVLDVIPLTCLLNVYRGPTVCQASGYGLEIHR